MGGAVGVESELGQGSTSWFTLPFVAPSAADVAAPAVDVGPRAADVAAPAEELAAAAEDKKPGAQPPLAKPSPPFASSTLSENDFRVLVAEDNLVNQKVAVRMLRAFGVPADIAVNGREAVEMCAARAYRMVLMDCHMPEVDGFEATREIRKQEAQGAHVPIVAMTADAMVCNRDACHAAGMDDFVSKPVTLADFARVLEEWTSLPAPSTGTE